MLCSPAIVAMVQTIILGKLNDQTNVLELDSSRFRNDRARTFHISGPVKDVQIYNNVFSIEKELDIPVFLFTNWEGWSQGVFAVDKQNIYEVIRSFG
jgi:hypothetical protein